MTLAVLVDLDAALRTERFGRVVRGFETCGSTNTEAMAWARDGAPEGALVLTEHQAAGRGRFGRTWHDTSGQSLLFSVVLRPALPPDRLGLVTLAGGLAVTEAVADVAAPADPAIKWPNDVLLGGRKCCGMLLESSLGGPSPFVVLGIGLNVNQQAFPDEIAERATSLRLETGQLILRTSLLARLLGRLEHWTDQLALGGEDAVRQAFIARMAGLGKPATVRLAGRDQRLEGTVEGVDATGALRLRVGETVHILHAGDVTLRSVI